MRVLRKIRGAAGLFLAIALMAATVGSIAEPAMVYAEEEVAYLGEKYPLKEKGEWKYIVTGNSAVIMGYTGTVSAVTIPSELDGHPVVAVGNNKPYSWDNGKGAFENNNSMQTVTVPSSVSYIDEGAFRKCSGLQQVLISDGVKEIGKYAFADCSYMQRVQFKGTTLKTIGYGAFENCAALDSLTIPESVTTIGDLAFEGCAALSSIEIPDSVTSLGGACFARCTSLAKAIIGNGVQNLEAIETYSIQNGNSDKYKLGTFEHCTSLREVVLGRGITQIGMDAFADTALQEVKISDNVVTIDKGAFMNCKDLRSVAIADGVKTIGNYAFTNDVALERVVFGKNIRTIGYMAFLSDSSLKEVTIPDSVTSLGGACFARCTSLAKVIIGNGVQNLETIEPSTSYWDSSQNGNSDSTKLGTFEHCTSLREVVFGDGITRIDIDAFADTALWEVTIPDNVVTIKNGAFMNCKELHYIKVGSGVTSMGSYVLAYNTALEDIQLGKGLVSIGNGAFLGCSALEELMIPSSVTSLGGGLCANNTSLKTVIIGNGVQNLKAIEPSTSYWDSSQNGNSDSTKLGAFEHCTALQNVSLGSGLTEIGVDAFADTGVTSLLIPEKVSVIQSGAFYIDGLQKLYFTGAASTLGKIFNKTIPSLYKIAGKSGYDALTNYTFEDFTPITVRFDLNEDVFAIEPNPQYMTPEGGYVIEPIDPMAEGYRFLGWYQDSACTVPWNFLENKVTNDTMLYAKWVKLSEAIPEAPKLLVQESVTDSIAVLSWQAVEGATGYQVYVDGVLVTEEPIAECTYQLTGLAADSTYEVTVAAVNKNGESEKSLVKVVQTSEKVPYRMGDVNRDDKIDSKDALAVLKHSVGLEQSDFIEEVADVNKDTKIDSKDALEILKHSVGLIVIE